MRQLNLVASPQLSYLNPRLYSHCLFFSPQSTFNLRIPSLSLTNYKLSVKCRQSDFYDPHKLNSPRPPSSDSYTSVGETPSKVFVGHSIYKGKAALTVEPRAPEFAALESGAFKIAREGCVILQFAPSTGVRQYDWSRKQVFSLSVTEIGTLLSLGARDSCEFFHDPNKGRSDEGKVRKVLKVEPLPDGSGHFFNLSVQNKLLNMDESIYIPITKAEFAILTSAFNSGLKEKKILSKKRYDFGETLLYLSSRMV